MKNYLVISLLLLPFVKASSQRPEYFHAWQKVIKSRRPLIPVLLIFTGMIFIFGYTARAKRINDDSKKYSRIFAERTRNHQQNKDTTYSNSTQQMRSDKIPDSVFNMTSLKHLSIQGMDCDYGDNKTCWGISEIPPQIINLKNLETLVLNVNAIQKIPVELTGLRRLRTLDLSDNVTLRSVDNIEYITSLQTLSLHGCGLKHLPEKIGDLKNLRQLGLVGNPVDQKERERIKKALPLCRILF